MLQNNRLSDYNINCETYEDWMAVKNKLKGSAIQNATTFKQNWFIVEDFRGSTLQLWNKLQNEECGIELSGTPLKFDIVQTLVNGTYNHYTYAITQRLLTINKGIISLQ